MGSDVAESVELPFYCTVKVHRLMCSELKILINKISHIPSDIESARPGCTAGIHALFSFRVAVDKSKLLIQYCSESSKLYLIYSLYSKCTMLATHNLFALHFLAFLPKNNFTSTLIFLESIFMYQKPKAITADRIQLRFERVRKTLELCLSQIQNIVPSSLAAKISDIIHDITNAKFPLEPSEDEAGKVLLALLQRSISASRLINQLELEALQLAALRLNITSPLDLLIEKRSIKRLIEKICDADTTKKKVLKYLLYLLRKYGELICKHKTESTPAAPKELYHQSIETQLKLRNEWNENPVNESGVLEPPEEFKCPISLGLMYDPVVIASGKTFERVWIQKWFSDGHNICPKTHMRLDNVYVTPNVAVKGLISKWCLKHGISIPEPHSQPMPALLSSRKPLSSSSVASFGSSMDDLCLRVSNVSFPSSDTDHGLHPSNGKTNDSLSCAPPLKNANSHRYQSSMTRHGTDLKPLSKLAFRPWGSQCDAVENVKKLMKENSQSCHLAFLNSYVKPLIKFLKDAHYLCDAKAQKDGAEVLLAILSQSRDEMPLFHEDEICTFALFLDSEIMEKALEIIEVLSHQQCYASGLVASGIIPSITKFLDTGTRESHELAIKILCNLSSSDNFVYHILYLDCTSKLVRLLEDPILSRYCIKIINALCTSEARTAVAESNPCINSIAKLLESGTREEQEHIVDVLLSLCHERTRYCQLANTESIIQCVVDISVNGNSRGKETAKEFLMLLDHCKEDNASECSTLRADMLHDSSSHYTDNKTSSVASKFLGKKIARFLRSNH